MLKKLIIFVLPVIIIAAAIIFLVIPSPLDDTGYKSEVIITNLDTPWAIAFLPDDRMIFTERGGKVKIWNGVQVIDVGNIDVKEVSESGLLGIAVDPDYNKNKYIYLYYTSQNNGNRVSRFHIKDNNLTDETVLMDNIPSSGIHNGGRIKFGPDGKLYIATGDAGDEPLAQDINSLAGKILRINKDGSIPDDNPFGNYVYSYGHRNPQGITWDTSNGLMYASEHGSTRNDEINIIEKGGNYGWPIVQCDSTTDQYINPLRCFNEFTLAPSGITFYENSIFVTGLRGNQLRRLILDSSGNKIISEEEIFNNLGRIRDVVEYKGYLYIATSNRDGRGVPKIDDDKIIRIKTVN